ncbi:MGH1-like glycoside hydrolase domain-containing protein [Hungatella sp. SB206]|uniref:MGH1-like glycoside hydrolase domain-containing protein n=1 Tax=Hungatella sp. SB206 TaxID=2937758 RepID=UPI003DA8F390
MDRDYSFLDSLDRGMYFDKKEYDGAPLLSYEEVKDRLPVPIVSSHPEWVDCYNYAIQVLYTNVHRPTEGSGFVSNFVDAAFNDDIFLWDTVFMTLFCNLLHPYVPGICSLDNFYCKQFDDGEIPREMVRDTGKDFLLWVNAFDSPLYSYFQNHYGFRTLRELGKLPYEDMYKPNMGRIIEKKPYLTLDNLNHPLLAFAEWESYCHTRDAARLHMVFEPLYHYHEAMKYHLRHQNGLYVTDWASMDNSPRNKHLGLAVDTSSEMAMFAGNLIDIMDVLVKRGYEVPDYDKRREGLVKDRMVLIEKINHYMWNEQDGFYYDMTFGERQTRIKTIAGFFPLVSGVADEKQGKRLIEWLEDKETFNRVHRIPVVAADEEGYDPRGGYWRGSVWAPTNALVTCGLEKHGFHKLAKDIAINHLDVIAKVYEQTGTIWENYPPDEISSGDADNKDFVGWSGLAPILYLVQYAAGLSLDRNETETTVRWEISEHLVRGGVLGCKQYWFAGKTADFEAADAGGSLEVSIHTEDCFKLNLIYQGAQHSIMVQGDMKLTF